MQLVSLKFAQALARISRAHANSPARIIKSVLGSDGLDVLSVGLNNLAHFLQQAQSHPLSSVLFEIPLTLVYTAARPLHLKWRARCVPKRRSVYERALNMLRDLTAL